MEWSETNDIYLCREILCAELFQTTKKKTVQRAQSWEKIAEKLNGYDNPKFSVSKRAVRDRYGVISAKFRKKNSAEVKATGIAPAEPTELEVLLEDLVEREYIGGRGN